MGKLKQSLPEDIDITDEREPDWTNDPREGGLPRDAGITEEEYIRFYNPNEVLGGERIDLSDVPF